MTPGGQLTTFGAPNPMEITAGPDGRLWFTSRVGPVGRIITGGQLTMFQLPEGLYPTSQFITSGPDGNLWFTVQGGRIGRITPTGTITEFPTPGGYTDPRGIATGADGDIWFAESNGKAVGRLRLPHAVHTVGVFRGGGWYLRNSLSAGAAQVQFSFGAAGDPPLRFRLR
jgi:streptogramin lyase